MKYGCEVTIVDTQRAGPLEKYVGRELSAVLKKWLNLNGISYVTDAAAKANGFLNSNCQGSDAGCSPSGVAGEGPVRVDAIGSIPNVEWLSGNGLNLSDGVDVDNRLRVREYGNVVAAGDVARYPNPWRGTSARVELWKNSIETAKIAGDSVAEFLSGHSPGRAKISLPRASTDLAGLRIHSCGRTADYESMEVIAGDLTDPARGIVARFHLNESVVGAAYVESGGSLLPLFLEESIKIGRHGEVSTLESRTLA